MTTTEGHIDDRTPPNDIAAEQSVLGGMLLDPPQIDDVAEIVTSSDFYQPRHAQIFNVLVELHAAGQPTDPVTVAAALTDRGLITKVGGALYLHELTAVVPTVMNTTHYARIVADRALLRTLVATGIQITHLGYGARDAVDAVDRLDRAQQLMLDAGQHRADRPDGLAALMELIQPALDEIEAANVGDRQFMGVPTGFTDLDRLLGGGFLPGQLAVLAARPGVGKSVAALCFARNAAIKHNLAVGFFTLEMSSTEVVMRTLAAEARIPLHALRGTQPMTDADWSKLTQRMGEIAEAPLFVDDTPSMNLMEIRAKARRLKQRHDLKMIVVDYLGLMTSAAREETRQQEVAAMSRGLKLLAKEVECPVIAVHQLNRGPEQRADKRPQLSDLRESGAIEQDADIVVLLHRDDYYDKEGPRAGEADFIVAKHRNGPTDTITVASQLHLSRFVDMAII